jgi:transcriptional antiterminator
MSSVYKYTVERAMGNNAVLVREQESKTEWILLGKGLGFAKATAYIQGNDPRIDKVFRLNQPDQLQQYKALLSNVDAEVFAISEKIIALMEQELTGEVNVQVHVALPSHIQFALYRLKNGMDIVNPFLYETRALFPREYEIAKEAAQLISKEFSMVIPESEVGFLAYHVHSAFSSVPVGRLVKLTNAITEMVDYIEQRLSIRIPKDSLDYAHLITHLQAAMKRIRTDKIVKNPFLSEIKANYQAEYLIASELAIIMGEALNATVCDNEIAFITMHLYRLFQEFNLST